MSKNFAHFNVGQLIQHTRFDYRGVIVDVDPSFQGTEEWYDEVARSRPPRDSPWYHVLVDGASHTTYVAERHLEEDASGEPVRHPALDLFFARFEDGHYIGRQAVN